MVCLISCYEITRSALYWWLIRVLAKGSSSPYLGLLLLLSSVLIFLLDLQLCLAGKHQILLGGSDNQHDEKIHPHKILWKNGNTINPYDALKECMQSLWCLYFITLMVSEPLFHYFKKVKTYVLILTYLRSSCFLKKKTQSIWQFITFTWIKLHQA